MIFNYLSEQILNLVTGKIKSISGTGVCYLALCTQKPAASGGTLYEITSSSYERMQLNINQAMQYTDKWGDVTNSADGKGKMITNKYEIASREATNAGGWPSAVYFVIMDAKEGGNALVGDWLRDPNGAPDATTGLRPKKALTVGEGQVAVFKAGDLQLELTSIEREDD